MADLSEFNDAAGIADITVECALGGWIIRTYEPIPGADPTDMEQDWVISTRVCATESEVLNYLAGALIQVRKNASKCYAKGMEQSGKLVAVDDDDEYPGMEGVNG